MNKTQNAMKLIEETDSSKQKGKKKQWSKKKQKETSKEKKELKKNIRQQEIINKKWKIKETKKK